MTWLFDWSACLLWGLLGHGWRTPKGWIAHEAERVRQVAERKKIEEKAREFRVQRALDSVSPVVYHGDTPSKEPVVTLPQMDDLPNPTSPIYLFVVVTNENDDYQVVRSSSEDPYIPNLQSNELVQDANDFGTYSTEGRARAVAKKLNDEERARRFA